MFVILIIVGIIICVILVNSRNKEIAEQKRIDENNWNKGICPHCKCEWELYNYDRDLGRVYKCKNGHMTNVVTNVDDK